MNHRNRKYGEYVNCIDYRRCSFKKGKYRLNLIEAVEVIQIKGEDAISILFIDGSRFLYRSSCAITFMNGFLLIG